MSKEFTVGDTIKSRYNGILFKILKIDKTTFMVDYIPISENVNKTVSSDPLNYIRENFDIVAPTI